MQGSVVNGHEIKQRNQFKIHIFAFKNNDVKFLLQNRREYAVNSYSIYIYLYFKYNILNFTSFLYGSVRYC